MADRRAFLQGLVSLPLIGGGVTLIGQPSAVAEPVTLRLAAAYKTFLQQELRMLAWEMADYPKIAASHLGDRMERTRTLEAIVQQSGIGNVAGFHRWTDDDKASRRAALVLSAVGADWRDTASTLPSSGALLRRGGFRFRP